MLLQKGSVTKSYTAFLLHFLLEVFTCMLVLVYYLTNTLRQEGKMKIEFSPNTPIYIQVMEYVKKEIVTGHLLSGDKIPSVRELASELQVNPNTIQRTFQELERDGVVVTRRGMGRYVTNEGEKTMDLRKDMAKELLHSFIDGMDNLGFSEEEILSILRSSLHEKREENE